jgi:hypothetical protein
VAPADRPAQHRGTRPTIRARRSVAISSGDGKSAGW